MTRPIEPSAPPLGMDGKPLVPVTELVVEANGRTFHYNEVCILDGLSKHPELNDRAVRICRGSLPNEGHDGRIKVQFIVGEVETFAKPENVFKLTFNRRARLSDSDKAGVALYEEMEKKCLGVDMKMGGPVYSTR